MTSFRKQKTFKNHNEFQEKSSCRLEKYKDTKPLSFSENKTIKAHFISIFYAL